MREHGQGCSRLKREEYKHTCHDSVFSPWKILIGPSDWENYSFGKDGAERYRTENLPASCSCPGLYELGIFTHYEVSCKVRQVNSGRVIVVYLGQADNVRTRLQHYGRSGSHLDHGNSICPSNEKQGLCHKKGPGLFKEIFLRGFPIVFRWAPMHTKKEAQKIESQLLETFDYAWNMGRNGVRRRECILLRLDKNVPNKSNTSTILELLHNWKSLVFGEKQVGIKINGSVPSGHASKHTLSSSDDPLNKLIPSVFKFSKSRPQLIWERLVLNEDSPVCEVAVGDGSVCTNKAVEGRKRCNKHKGMKINGTAHKFVVVDDRKAYICGINLGDGSLCTMPPMHRQKRCELHEGQKIATIFSQFQNSKPRFDLVNPKLVAKQLNAVEDYSICGVNLRDGSICRNRPFHGRKRCSEHKGKRISGSRLASTKANGNLLKQGKSDICGFGLEDGSICQKLPVQGRKRCEAHKGRRVTTTVCSLKVGQPKGTLQSRSSPCINDEVLK
ncbi:protein EFFECTOR OF TRANSCRIPTION 2-like [Aristolochia californica]|uniref:protein EFFECTOR OF TRANSCRIPTION 2-like n=1 Tax=Aristolochia californica TaxID=171875 RepID=UPI0035D661E9